MEGMSATLLAQSGSNSALFTFALYTMAVFVVAWFSNRLLQGKSFLSEYFLGSRSLGMWAFALTFAATSASGGSFTGFPAKIYTHGWILALWIASYMVVPICSMGLLAKRINQVARISGSITVPDVIRDRFESRWLGLLATLLIVFFVSFNLVAQFKAGSLILQALLRDVEMYHQAGVGMGVMKNSLGWWPNVDPEYLVCLFAFSVAVIAYTTYGGFHAVVWTDVMQGVVMVLGVLIMLPLALWQVGGLESASQRLAEMTPPRMGTCFVWLEHPAKQEIRVPAGQWLAVSRDQYLADFETFLPEAENTIKKNLQGKSTSAELETALAELRQRPTHIAAGPDTILLRVAKTRVIRQGSVTVEKLSASGSRVSDPVEVVELTTPREIAEQLARLVQEESQRRGITEAELTSRPTVSWLKCTMSTTDVSTYDYLFGAAQPGRYYIAQGPKLDSLGGFFPLSLAISFFFMWAISGAGQPQNMVRLMAFNSATTLRRSMFTVAIYYSLIYFPLVIIFCCARVLSPGMDAEPDGIMPHMAVLLTTASGNPWLAGLLIAAPFAAVMSTVDSFLLMVSSALVRDLYQRNINPQVSERRIKWMSYASTFVVGFCAMYGAIDPPQFLQDIIVYVGSGLAAAFLAPVSLSLYWPRVTASGVMSGMLAGFGAHLGMYLLGWVINGSFFKPYQLLDFDPILIGLLVSFITVPLVSLLSPPPPEHLVRKYFCRPKS